MPQGLMVLNFIVRGEIMVQFNSKIDVHETCKIPTRVTKLYNKIQATTYHHS